MGSIHAYQIASGERRYRATYRDNNHCQHTKRGFRTKKAATTYLASIETQLATGNYVDPHGGDITIAELERTWAEGHKAIWAHRIPAASTRHGAHTSRRNGAIGKSGM